MILRAPTTHQSFDPDRGTAIFCVIDLQVLGNQSSLRHRSCSGRDRTRCNSPSRGLIWPLILKKEVASTVGAEISGGCP